MREPKFIWDEGLGKATCYLNDGKRIFTGEAVCSEIDSDMKSEKTGCQIALYRAEINYYLHLRDNEIKPALEAFKHAYACVEQSKQFNPKSYEARMMRKEIHRKEFDMYVIKTMLADKRSKLKSYLEDKDFFYQQVRKFRKKSEE